MREGREGEVLKSIRWHRDYYAGALVALVGAGVAVQSSLYEIGSLTAIGPGFFPMVMGTVLALCGIVIAVNAGIGGEDDHDAIVVERGDWRGWLCIVGGLACFIVLAKSVGLFPATFACVFVSALGDRTTTLRAAATLAFGIATFGVLLFYYGLKIQLPPFVWPSL